MRDGMPIGNISRHGCCRFIAGDPRDALELGEAIYCGRPVAHPGLSWCAEHEAVVFLPADYLKRKAA